MNNYTHMILQNYNSYRIKEIKTMKKTSMLIITFLALCTFAFSQSKIAVVNAQDILMKSKKGIEVGKKIEEMNNKKLAEANALQEEMKKLEKEIASPALTDDAREKKSLELANKQKNFKRYYEDSKAEMDRQTQTELMALEKELMPIIDTIGKAKGYTIIFDISGRQGIVFVDPAADITEEVIKAADAKYVPSK